MGTERLVPETEPAWVISAVPAMCPSPAVTFEWDLTGQKYNGRSSQTLLLPSLAVWFYTDDLVTATD